ncbi:hypothetical protein [Campylobacter sp. LH-2024]|uniref:hypothetical protein n=1 Tax=Campylobacter sp. LH-2024 TaxID=3239825 RepID=UPI003B8C69B1
MKDYGISYIPNANQSFKEPSEPIVSDKLSIQKVNELIDKKLNLFKEDMLNKEELKSLIQEILKDGGFQNTNIKISKTPPTYKTEAEVGEIWAVLESKKQLFICISKDEKFTNWVDLLGDGSNDIIPKEKIIITFDNTTTGGQYGGCMSDLRLGFENGFATPNKVQDEYENAKFTMTKDGDGLNRSDFTIDSNPTPTDNQIVGTIKTSGIYQEIYHKIAHVFKKYNGGADECCLWSSSGSREVSIELENTQMPNQLFARGNGYYGQTEISNVKAKKSIFVGEKEVESEDFNVNKLEADSNTYGDYAFLFEISKQEQDSANLKLKESKPKKPKNTKKSNKE